jgi:hypothetical protein
MVRTFRPHSLLLILSLVLSIAACSTTQPTPPASAKTPSGPVSDTPPANWEPVFWDRAMRDAQVARASGDRAAAERACARGILYVQAQTIKMLYSYADMLDVQNLGSGVPVRTKAQKLEQARDAQAQARTSGNTYLAFDPSAELRSYAELLGGMKRNTDALSVEALASAYRYAQDANLRRTQLQRDGKEPYGEC